ncbi:MAG: TauD/TfdA family dioxygenase [Deltaproteobacteria bacterium]|nr:TauD/TfdA family dioxygenase [Deltaproteobacteria bacterium]
MSLGDVTLDRGPGRLFQADGRALVGLPVKELRALFREHGFLAFRGWNASISDFYQFGKRFMDRLRTTPEAERPQHPIHRGMQTVSQGDHAMNFHADFGQLPDRPEAIAFYCQVAPESEGETFVCDGIQLWESLDEATRRLFEQRRITQCSSVDWRLWTSSAGTTDFDVVRAFMEEREGVQVSPGPLGALQVRWTTWAAARPKFSDRTALASNVFPGVYNGLTTTWEDGTPLDAALVQHLETRARALSTVIRWAAGDFAVVDNTRYVHARAAQDARRKLYTLQGFMRG